MLAGARSAAGGSPFVVSELQTHHGRFGDPSSGVSPEALEVISWQALAHGARSVTYWKWRPFIRGEQTGSRGLTSYDGTPVDRAAVARHIAAAVDRNPTTLGSMRSPAARAAILVDPACFVYAPIMGGPDPDSDQFASEEILGFVRLLGAEGIDVEFLHGARLEERDLAEFPLIVLPCQYVLDADGASRLRSYVEGGGTLISSSRLAIMNRANLLYESIPGGLTDVVGFSETDMAAIGETVQLQKAGELTAGSRFRQAIKVVNGAEVIDRFGADTSPVPGINVEGMPAIMHNRFGDGHTWHFAFDFGHGAHHAPDGSAFSVFRSLLEPMLPLACFDPLRIMKSSGACEVHCLPCPGGAVIMAVNHTTEENKIDVERGPSIAAGNVVAIDLDAATNATSESIAGLIQFTLPALGTAAVHVVLPDGRSGIQ